MKGSLIMCILCREKYFLHKYLFKNPHGDNSALTMRTRAFLAPSGAFVLYINEGWACLPPCVRVIVRFKLSSCLNLVSCGRKSLWVYYIPATGSESKPSHGALMLKYLISLQSGQYGN